MTSNLFHQNFTNIPEDYLANKVNTASELLESNFSKQWKTLRNFQLSSFISMTENSPAYQICKKTHTEVHRFSSGTADMGVDSTASKILL